MNLSKKKNLAAKTLGVGKVRIVFNTERLSEIKEAITKQDIRDLFASKAIWIKNIKGRKSHDKRRNRRRKGSVRKQAINKKQQYVLLTRKLRAHLAELKRKKTISKEHYLKLRKEIKASLFKNKHHFKEAILALKS
jgi:large subunit ribosomal protein L19e